MIFPSLCFFLIAGCHGGSGHLLDRLSVLCTKGNYILASGISVDSKIQGEFRFLFPETFKLLFPETIYSSSVCAISWKLENIVCCLGICERI